MVTPTVHDMLADTLFGKARRSILALLYTRTDEQFYLRRIVRETGIGLGPAQRELKLLTAAGIIERQDRDRQVYYQANANCPVFTELKSLITKTVGLVDVVRSSLAPISGRIKAAFIYGSFASGSEKQSSDIDLMIVGAVTFAEISGALSLAQKKLQREINSAVYSSREFRRRFKEEDHFIRSLMDDAKIFVIGNKDELERLVK